MINGNPDLGRGLPTGASDLEDFGRYESLFEDNIQI